MIPGSANPLLLASAAEAAGYNIERSLRFNSADSAYLSRTPSVAGNRKTWTWAGWVKIAGIGGNNELFTAGTDVVFGPGAQISVNTSSSIRWLSYTGTFQLELITAQVFRDPSAWYHLVFSLDTTQAISTDRAKLYVNGTQVTTFGTATYPSQNADLLWNQAQLQAIGTNATAGGSGYFSGYLADIHFIDGQALDPTSFGEFDTNGVWQPKAYTGTYPGNSFHLPFSDNSTAAALGTDTSGNGNTWTVNNISVAAGSDNDSLVDTPTSYGTDTGAGGEVRGNYATGSPLFSVGASLRNLVNGNLDWVYTSGTQTAIIPATVFPASGKWYAEFLFTSFATGARIGIVNTNCTDVYVGQTTTGVGYENTGQVRYNGGVTSYGASWTANDLVGVALDLDNGTVSFYKNGASQGVARSGLTGSWTFGVDAFSGTCIANFGQRPFAYTAPSGYKALCTTNLPEPQTITTSGSYTGNGVADGPFVYLNGVPTAMTVNGTAVTFGTHADKLSNGFKLRTTSTTYNQNAATYNYSVTSTGPTFKTARAQAN